VRFGDHAKTPRTGLSAIGGLCDVEDSDGEMDTIWHEDVEDYESDHQDDNQEPDYRSDSVRADVEFNSLLHAMSNPDRRSSDDFGCLKTILHGTCTNKTCSFNHKEDALLKTATEIGTKCSAWLQNSKSPSPGLNAIKQPTAILQREPGSRC
jgi:hypothetical protein